jgi:RHS repeat-associated protein
MACPFRARAVGSVWTQGVALGWFEAGPLALNLPLMTNTRGRDLSGSLAGAGGIGGLLARSYGYSGGNWSNHNAYHADGNGNVTALASSAGALQASYRYDPYGRYLAGGGTLAGANVLRFSSKPWVGFAGSATSGLYYYGYRFYDPYLQRWMNRDPLGETASVNLYSFLDNQTLDHLDAAGLFQSSPVPSGTAGCTTKEYWQLQRWIAESCEGGPRPVPFVPPIIGPSEDDLKTKPLDLDDCIDACKERYKKPEQKKDLWLCIQKCAQIYPPKHPKYKPPKPGKPTRGPQTWVVGPTRALLATKYDLR